MLFLYSLNIKSQDNAYVDFEKKFDTELVYNIYAKLKPNKIKIDIFIRKHCYNKQITNILSKTLVYVKKCKKFLNCSVINFLLMK